MIYADHITQPIVYQSTINKLNTENFNRRCWMTDGAHYAFTAHGLPAFRPRKLQCCQLTDQQVFAWPVGSPRQYGVSG